MDFWNANSAATCSRDGCDEPLYRTWGRGRKGGYCVKHWRFLKMRNTAQRDGKVIPSYDALESHGACRHGLRSVWPDDGVDSG